MKIATIVGARPQFIKAAPVATVLAARSAVDGGPQLLEVLIHTGQHYDEEMSQLFFDELGLRAPDYNLGVGSGPHGAQTGEMLKRVEEVLRREEPDVVLVYGDTNSTLAGALAAAKLHIPVAHVEAGLRSFNRDMPEEINRVVTDHVSTLLFAPTRTAVENLRREGITEAVHLVGDVMYDAARKYLSCAEARSRVLDRLDLKCKQFVLATVHRAENTDVPRRMEAILAALQKISQGRHVVFPVHPRTRQALAGSDAPRPPTLMMTEPLSYLDMLLLESHASLILTDSGGVQKEAFFFRVPCITLRDETEWVETVETGWNTLAGADEEKILSALGKAKCGRWVEFPYGRGNAAQRLVDVLLEFDRNRKGLRQ